jgi:hypothetical protein
MGTLTSKACQYRGVATEVLVLIYEKTHKTPFYCYLGRYLAFKHTVNVSMLTLITVNITPITGNVNRSLKDFLKVY